MAIDGGELSASRLSHFTPGERASDAYCMGSGMHFNAGVGAVEEGKSLAPAGNRTPAVQPIVRRCTD
jgi:hypothetical protein